MPDIGLSYPSDWGPQTPYAEPRHGRRISDMLGPLQRVVPPSGTVATLAEVKAQCKVDFADDDAILMDMLAGATELAEDTIDGKRQFLTATYDVPVRGFWHGELQFPRPPLQSLTISYYATDGTLTTLASSSYIVTTPWRGPGRVERAPNIIWPTLQYDRRYPVVIRFVCGYGATLPATLPLVAKRAVLMIVDHNYRYRGGDDENGKTSALEIPPAAMNLLRSLSWGSVF